MAADQEVLRQMGKDTDAIKNELVKQYTKHIEDEELDAGDGSVVKVKLVVIGPPGAGKTSWVSQLINSKFNQAEQPTVGAKFSTQGVAIEDFVYNFEIWDVSGEDWCKTLVPMYLQYAQAAVVCYDSSDPQSFEKSKEWVEIAKRLGEKGLMICYAGMKSDLSTDDVLPPSQITDFFVNEQSLKKEFLFPTVSARTGDGVQDVMLTVAEALHEQGGPTDHRGSVLNVEDAMKNLVNRAQDPNAGDERIDNLKENVGWCAKTTRLLCGMCFESSKEITKQTLESAKVNGKEFSKTLNRNSRRLGTKVKNRAAELVRNMQTKDQTSVVEVGVDTGTDQGPQTERLKQ